MHSQLIATWRSGSEVSLCWPPPGPMSHCVVVSVTWQCVSLEGLDCSRSKTRTSRYLEPGWQGSEGRARPEEGPSQMRVPGILQLQSPPLLTAFPEAGRQETLHTGLSSLEKNISTLIFPEQIDLEGLQWVQKSESLNNLETLGWEGTQAMNIMETMEGSSR